MAMRRILLRAFAALCLLCASLAALADDLRPGYLELRQIDAQTYDVFWKVPARGDDLRLGIYVVFPEDSIALSEPRGAFHAGAHSERWRVQRPGGLIGQTVRIDGLSSMVTDVLVRVERSDGTTQVTRLLPSQPAFVVEASAGRAEVAGTYLGLGVEHILIGVDHLLFVLALLLLVDGLRTLAWTITAFTVAHSITLSLAALDLIRIPLPPVEACIALSIAFVAAEIVRTRQGLAGLTERHPWMVAFTFGLLHGLGFAAALGEIGLPQTEVPAALLFFNVGVEIGQLLFVAAVLLLARLLRAIRLPLPAAGRVLFVYGIGTVASFWAIERTVGFWG
jgi:hydrogenase/urease accessory protein HupE